MKNLTIFIIILTFSYTGLASELAPRSFLGVSGGNSTTNINGALIDRVITGGTGESLGLISGDIITSINLNPINGFSQLIEVLQSIPADKTIKVSVYRNNKTINMTGIMKPRPKERPTENQNFEIIYDSVEINNNHLRSIVYRPKTTNEKNKMPAVYFIQGYTCDSIDYGFVPQSSGHQLLTSIADAGYVVYKIEKFGVGDSIGDYECSQIDFSTELQGFKAGLKALKAYDFVDKNQVHIFGHSLGGVYAPLVAEHSPVKSLIAYGAVVKSWHDYLLDIFSKQALIYGTSKEQAKENTQTVAPFLKAWLKSEENWQEIIDSTKYQTIIDSNLIPISGDQVFNRHYSFFRNLNGIDLIHAWKNTQSHVLAIHGSLDIQAINDEWATQMTSLPKKKQLRTKKVVLQGAEHGFLKYQSMSDYLIARANRSYNPGQPGKTYDRRVSKTIIDWLDTFKKI